MRKVFVSAVLAAVSSTVMVGCENAGAVVLTPGVTTPLTGTTLAAEPFLAGTVLQDVLSPFTLTYDSNTVTGDVQSRVVQETGSGTLDFYWRITTDPTSTGDISYLRLGNFAAGTYDADYRIDGLGDVAPTSAYLFTNPTPGYINFFFSGGLGGGDSSNFIFLHTDATSYSSSAFLDLASAGTYFESNEIATFSPGVPELPTWLMMFLGFAGLGFTGHRQLKSAQMQTRSA